MHHTLAFTALDTAAASNQDIPAITDFWATVSANNHYILPDKYDLLLAYAQDAGATNARVNVPSFREVSIPSIQPVNRSAAPTALAPICQMFDTRLSIPANEEVAFELSNDGAGGVRAVGALWIGKRERSIPAGNLFTVRGTGTIAAVANTWTAGGFVLDQVLPYGQYSVVGLRVTGANLVLARLQFQNYVMRPGCIALPTVGMTDWPIFRWGGLGEWGRFNSTAQPNLEIFATGANAAQVVFMDLIRLS